MKQLLTTAIIIASAFSFHSAFAQSSRAELQKIVDELQASCPINAGDNISITGVELVADTMAWHYSIRDFGTLQRTKPADMLSSIMTNLPLTIQTKPHLRPLYQSLVDLNVTYKLVFRSETTGKVVSGIIPPERMTEILNTEASPERSLESIVSNSRRTLPASISRGLVMKEKLLTDKALVTVCEVDDSIINFSNMQLARDAMYHAMAEQIAKSTDPATLFEINACILTGRGYTFIYRAASTGDEIPIHFPAETLRKLTESKK